MKLLIKFRGGQDGTKPPADLEGMLMADIQKWAESHATINEYGYPVYSQFVCHIANLFDERARDTGCACEWVSPYGFVPEDGCEKHDAWTNTGKE